ncbi:DUF2178 domain-containing protein [Candidatus Woesearchaeota archaeon]|nr:DUF2178 domain-containing protein [Candidatus Woesearchaeota archaeon]
MKKNVSEKTGRWRLAAIIFVAVLVIITGALFAYMSFVKGNIVGGIAGTLIALVIVGFALFVYMRGNRDLKAGFPIQDERSKKVLERASSRAFYISLYLLLAVGFLSEHIPFRDVSQATGITVGVMALVFAVNWAYYNRKGV